MTSQFSSERAEHAFEHLKVGMHALPLAGEPGLTVSVCRAGGRLGVTHVDCTASAKRSLQAGGRFDFGSLAPAGNVCVLGTDRDPGAERRSQRRRCAVTWHRSRG